ncbi:unnamed protein product [Allacma fusca]|uniref:Uncharacterized protein n=1 Tax=Allacma fusca TaxID=39272 RepID=A0A8J2Q197_9HEXA|nr:unnamed protein product [Allacma fusca]
MSQAFFRSLSQENINNDFRSLWEDKVIPINDRASLLTINSCCPNFRSLNCFNIGCKMQYRLRTRSLGFYKDIVGTESSNITYQ